MHIRPFQQEDEDSVVQLWTECGLVVPWNDPYRDIRRKRINAICSGIIERKLKLQADMFLVACADSQIVGTAMAGYDGHRGWVNYLAVHPQHQRAGIGRRLMAEAESRLRASGCPKINVQVRTANTGVIEFYRKLGFRMDDVVSLGKRLEPDA